MNDREKITAEKQASAPPNEPLDAFLDWLADELLKGGLI